jgi:hypothetical protein
MQDIVNLEECFQKVKRESKQSRNVSKIDE